MSDTLRGRLRRVLGGPWLKPLDPILTDAAFDAARVPPDAPGRARLDAWYAAPNGAGGDRRLVLGHRGASARAPENTLGAFRAALDDGGDGVELDTQLTADAVPIVLHDDTLDRTTDMRGLPIRHEAAELDAADAGSWFSAGTWGREKVPRLAEVLAALPPPAVINVELKGPTPRVLGLERRVVEVLRAFPEARVVVSSFHPAQLLELRALEPAIPLGLLWHDRSLLPLRTGWIAPFLRPEAIHPQCGAVDKGLVDAAHRAGVRVHVWDVKTPAQAELMLELGVDALICDDVQAMVRVRDRRGG